MRRVILRHDGKIFMIIIMSSMTSLKIMVDQLSSALGTIWQIDQLAGVNW